jgi:hypothetical protein
MGWRYKCLELDWVNQNKNDQGELPPIAYVHGELFGVGGSGNGSRQSQRYQKQVH